MGLRYYDVVSETEPNSIPLRVRRPTDRLERPLRDLRVSVIDTCNYRCPYCMPAEEYPENFPFLTKSQRLSFEEIERLVNIFTKLGVIKVRLTGGEPLLRKGLTGLIAALAANPEIEDLALTTNGHLLARGVDALREAGLPRLTLSLDSLDEAVFRRMNGGRGELSRVLNGLRAAEAAGYDSIKINCVVQRGVNDRGVIDLVEHFRGTGHVLRFIEYMDVGTQNSWRLKEVVPSQEVLERIQSRWSVSPVKPGYRGEVATRYRFDDGGGEIGFISSISAPFCGDCTRARLAADGTFYTCLFAGEGVDLKQPLRAGVTDAGMADIICDIWNGRTDRYSELRQPEQAELRRQRRIEMYQIGG